MFWWIAATVLLLLLWVGWRKRRQPQQKSMFETVSLPHGLSVFSYNKGETDIIYQEIWKHQAYLDPRGGLSLQSGAIVFDVGANIGLFSLYVREKCHGQASVYAFEPVPDVFQILAANAKQHHPDNTEEIQPLPEHRIHAFPYGLSVREEQVTFLHHPKLSIWSTAHSDMDQQRTEKLYQDLPALTSFILHNNAPRWLRWLPQSWILWGAKQVAHAVVKTTEITCSLRRLSTVIDEYNIPRIDLLKIDVEGHELAVLQGIEEHHWPLIRQIVLEVENIPTLRQIETLLTNQGFVCTHEFTHVVHGSGIEAELAYLWAKNSVIPKKP